MKLLILAFTLGLGTAATGSEITVRGGEHPDFTRLTFDAQDALTLKSRLDGRRFEILFENGPHKIQKEQAFDRLTTDRIKQLSTTSDKIIIDLNCTCEGRVGKESETLFFVDFFPPKSIIPAKNTQPLVSLPPIPPALNRIKPTLPPSTTFTKSADTIGKENVQTAHEEELKEKFIAALSHAAAEGMINLSPKNASPSSKPSSNMPPPSSTRIKSHVPISPRSSSQPLSNTFAPTCIKDTSLDIQNWGTPEAPAAKIFQTKSMLIGEFDNPNEQFLMSLVKAYLYAGYGAEALQILQSFSASKERFTPLTQVALIMDGKPTLDALESQITCNGYAAFWTFLGARKKDPTLDPNFRAILRTFSSLPPHLKRLTENQLIAQLNAYGGQNYVATVTHILSRDGAASINDANTAQLQAMLTQDTEHAPIAATKILRAKIADSYTPQNSDIQWIESLEREYKGTDQEADLAELKAFLFIKQDNFTEAINALSPFPVSDTNIQELWLPLVNTLLTTKSDALFVETALSHFDKIKSLAIATELKFQLAERLEKNGLHTHAKAFIPQDMRNDARAKQLQARIAVKEGKPAEALQTITLLNDSISDEIRQTALRRLGRYEDARKLSQKLEDPQRMQQDAWRAKNFTLSQDSPILDSIIHEMSTPPQTNSPQLASSDSLINQAATARRRAAEISRKINSLLDEIKSPSHN
ncbi:MAG: hypothetical protein ACPGVK_05820 [Halocynthiibacter sp.]